MGPPSGVWTGQRKPQLSGRSFLGAVVFIVWKNWPLWTDWKWLIYLIIFSRSAAIVYPTCCLRSNPVLLRRLPVARKYSIRFPKGTKPSINFFNQFISFAFSLSFPFLKNKVIFCSRLFNMSVIFSFRIIIYKWPERRISWFVGAS